MPGHDIRALLSTFSQALELKGPVIVHVRTQKGRGFTPAETDQIGFHGAALPPMVVPPNGNGNGVAPAPASPAMPTELMADDAAPPSSVPVPKKHPNYTAVLPEPTSPWSSLCIGSDRARSPSISLEYALLVGGQRKGSADRYASSNGPCWLERLREGLLAKRGRPGQRESEHEELVERQSTPSELCLVQGAWAVQRRERVGAERKLFARPELGWERVSYVSHQPEHLPAKVAQLLL